MSKLHNFIMGPAGIIPDGGLPANYGGEPRVAQLAGKDQMYSFPKTKFVNENTLDEQFSHIKSEYMEAVRAQGMGERDEELMDLWHSIESYFRMREAQGVDVMLTRSQTVYKNAQREYYAVGELEKWAGSPR